MAMDPVPPFVVAEGLDVGLYASQEAIDRHIEPVDVQGVAWKAFDAEGRRLEIVVERPEKPRRRPWNRGRVRVAARALDELRTDGDELAALLREWLPEAGAARPPANASLQDLLRRAIEHVGIRR